MLYHACSVVSWLSSLPVQKKTIVSRMYSRPVSMPAPYNPVWSASRLSDVWHISQPLLHKSVKGREDTLTEEEALKIIENTCHVVSLVVSMPISMHSQCRVPINVCRVHNRHHSVNICPCRWDPYQDDPCRYDACRMKVSNANKITAGTFLRPVIYFPLFGERKTKEYI